MQDMKAVLLTAASAVGAAYALNFTLFWLNAKHYHGYPLSSHDNARYGMLNGVAYAVSGATAILLAWSLARWQRSSVAWTLAFAALFAILALPFFYAAVINLLPSVNSG
jgi:hypothetical protein